MNDVNNNKDKQHILVISQYFYPEAFRINDICKEWVKQGYEVTVVTGIPNYPQGKFFQGYGWFRQRKEVYEGINIIRLPIVPRGKNAIMLVLNYLSFVVSGWFWKVFTKVKADKVFIFEVSPMTQALVGVWYAGKRNLPRKHRFPGKHKLPCYIYVQDLWPENVEIVTGISNKQIIGAIDRMVDYIYRHCNKIFATSPSFVKRIEERQSAWKDGESKVAYWPQYAEEFYKPAEKTDLSDLSPSDSFRIAFTGNIGYAQGLDILPRTAVLLKQQNRSCEFVIIGDGRYREEFEKEIAQNDVAEMFRLLGRKKPEEIPGYLAWCDMAFISFADNPLFSMTIPAKLQSYMACGMPILGVASGETKRVVEEAECGICVEGREAEALANCIINILQDEDKEQKLNVWRQNALTYGNREFNQTKLLDWLSENYLGK